MLSSRAPLWSLPRAHQHGAVTSLSCWASGTSTAPTTRVLLPPSLPPTQQPQQQGGGGGFGAAAAGLGSSPAPAPVSVPLQQLLVSGSKDGSVLVVDVQSGKVVSAMDKVREEGGGGIRVAVLWGDAHASCFRPGTAAQPLFCNIVYYFNGPLYGAGALRGLQESARHARESV